IGERKLSRRAPRWRAASRDDALRVPRRDSGSAFAVIEPDEVAERDRKIDILGLGEGVVAEFVLQRGDDDGEAERVEAGFEQHELLGQRRQHLALRGRDTLEFGQYRRPKG